jgi:tRNA1(Val) A37 N6-methylase TrmN6
MSEECEVKEQESERFKYAMVCRTQKGTLTMGTVDRRLSESLADKIKDGQVGIIDFQKVEDEKDDRANRLLIEIRKL